MTNIETISQEEVFGKALKEATDEVLNLGANMINRQSFCDHKQGFCKESYPVWLNGFDHQSGNSPCGIKTVKVCNYCKWSEEVGYQSL